MDLNTFTIDQLPFQTSEALPNNCTKYDVAMGAVPDEKDETNPNMYMDLIFAPGGEQPVPPTPPGPTIETVDLGLSSGTLWAKCNLGAQSETEYGDYYQWAATTPLHIEGTTVNPAAGWELCPYTDSEGNPSKYTGSDYDTLQTSDDVVASQFTGYRMPTQDDFQELIDETDNEWVEDFNGSGVNGYKFTSKSDSSKYIFLPAAGYCDDSDLYGVGGEGDYWSSSLNTGYPYGAWRLYFNNEEVGMDNRDRYFGFSIRAVKA